MADAWAIASIAQTQSPPSQFLPRTLWSVLAEWELSSRNSRRRKGLDPDTRQHKQPSPILKMLTFCTMTEKWFQCARQHHKTGRLLRQRSVFCHSMLHSLRHLISCRSMNGFGMLQSSCLKQHLFSTVHLSPALQPPEQNPGLSRCSLWPRQLSECP